jgi:hypothetical protein
MKANQFMLTFKNNLNSIDKFYLGIKNFSCYLYLLQFT